MAIKSDGGSSSYYDIKIPEHIWRNLASRFANNTADNSSYIKTEEIIEMLGSDFDIGNIIKCAVRINSLMSGVGKEGNSVEYDANKIMYSANRLKQRGGE